MSATIHCSVTNAGLASPTFKLFAVDETTGSITDTTADSGSAAEMTNADGVYTVTTSVTGWHLLIIYSSGDACFYGYCNVPASGTRLAVSDFLQAKCLDATISSRSSLDATGIRAAVGLTAANLDDQLGEIATDADAVATRLSATRAGYLDNLSAGAVPTLAQILAGGDIDGFTLEQTLKLCLSALTGKLSGAAGTTITIRSADDTADRIVATVDSSGNRSVVTLNAAG